MKFRRATKHSLAHGDSSAHLEPGTRNPEPSTLEDQYSAYATMTPVPGSARYWRPPTMYVIGVADVLCATFTFHTALPVFASSASSPPPPPTKRSPPAVDSTPER